MSFGEGKIVQLRVPRALSAPGAMTPPAVAPAALVPTAVPPGAAGAEASARADAAGGRQSTPLSVLSRDIEALQTVIASFGERERNTVKAFEAAVDALHKEALTRMIRALKGSPAAAGALREAAADEVVYAVLRHHDILKPSLQERVERALA